MFEFIYNSLETVKNLNFPSKKEIISLTIAVFIIVILAGLMFVLFDTFFTGAHAMIHSFLK